jgi:hypothetical protein
MSMMKLSFVRGLQSALVSTGAIPPYRTQYHADLAVKVASYSLPVMWKMATEEQVANAMSSMASGQEAQLSPEQQQAVMQAPQAPAEQAQEGSDIQEAVDALEQQAAMANAFADATDDAADKLEELQDTQAAKEVVAMLKSARARL